MSKVFTDRELLDRIAYKGPQPGEGQGQTRTYDWSGGVTDDVIWTPQSGNRFIVSLISISTTTKCTVTIFDEDDSEVDRLFKGSVNADAPVIIPFPIPRTSRDVDRKLCITTSGTGGYITVYGWETGYGDLTTTTSVTTSSSSSSTSSQTTSSSSSSTSSQTTSSSSSSQTTSSSSSSQTTSSSSQTTSSSSSSYSTSSSSSTQTTSSSSQTTT